MIINIEYVDIDYYEECEDDTITIGLDDDKYDQFLVDFYNFSTYYTIGYEIGEILNKENAEELLQEEYPDLTKEDAEFFADAREQGLSASLVVGSFIEKYPQYNCEYSGKTCNYIEFNDYWMKVNGIEYSL